jgi:hypothetical protein
MLSLGGSGAWTGPLTDASNANPAQAEATVRAQRIQKTVKPRFFEDQSLVSLAWILRNTSREDIGPETSSPGISFATTLPYF